MFLRRQCQPPTQAVPRRHTLWGHNSGVPRYIKCSTQMLLIQQSSSSTDNCRGARHRGAGAPQHTEPPAAARHTNHTLAHTARHPRLPLRGGAGRKKQRTAALTHLQAIITDHHPRIFVLLATIPSPTQGTSGWPHGADHAATTHYAVQHPAAPLPGHPAAHHASSTEYAARRSTTTQTPQAAATAFNPPVHKPNTARCRAAYEPSPAP